MSASEIPVVRRSRPPLIVGLRILLPAVAALTILAVVITAATSAFHAAEVHSVANKPVELIGPRLVGEDSRQRPYVITAATAERQDGAGAIRLNGPVLVRDQGGADQLRVTAKSGVFDQVKGQLQLTGDVHLTGPSGAFSTPTATYDAKSGEIVGSGAVQAVGSSGQLNAGAFQVKDRGKSAVFKGGVHSRINVK